jgi:hypothetical protein
MTFVIVGCIIAALLVPAAMVFDHWMLARSERRHRTTQDRMLAQLRRLRQEDEARRAKHGR